MSNTPQFFFEQVGRPGMMGMSGMPGISGMQGMLGMQGLPGMQGMPGMLGIPEMQGGMPMQGIPNMQGGMPMIGMPGMQGGMPLIGMSGMQGWLPEPTYGCISGMQGEGDEVFPGMQSLQYLMSMPNSAERKQWRRQIAELNDEIDELQEQLWKQSNSKKKIQQELNATITSLEQDKLDLEDQVYSLNNELRKQRRTISEKTDREQELMTSLQSLKQEYEEFQQYTQNQIDTAMSNTQGQQNQLNKLKNEIKELEEKNQKYKEEIEELTDEKQKLVEESDKEHKNFLSANDEVVSKNKQITQLNKKIKYLEDTLENQLRAFRQKYNELNENKFAYFDLKYENQQLQNQIDQLNKNELKFKEFLNNKNVLSESQIATELKKLQEQSENFSQQQQVQLQQYISKANQEKISFQKKMEDDIIAFQNLQKGQQKKNL